jgi:putative membrane-bound dehydrogenase-like protein
MRIRTLLLPLVFLPAFFPVCAFGGDGNRLAYLGEAGADPYYVSRTFPKLTTPQWVGEAGVDAVVILAIDDLKQGRLDSYEHAMRPALERMKQIDGRGHFSIMTCKVDPADPKLQAWRAEGVQFDVHTIDHFCPLLGHGGFEAARKSFEDCVDMMDAIPGNHAVAFRTPCCDSKNTLSPRFLAEIFNSATAKGNYLQVDSSVFHRFTADDPALPRGLVMDDAGVDRYARYVPFPSFANSIRDYPYPYVVGKLCWEFPCVTPSDWESFNIQGKAHPQLLTDWEAQLDATVIKKGTFTLVCHPYGWSSPEQLAELVDYADRTYGKRVKFLNFAEALERLTANLLGGQPLRAANGQDNGVRLLDLNNDGYLDVVIGNDKVRQTRVWDQKMGKWDVSDFPLPIVALDGKDRVDAGMRFGDLAGDGSVTALVRNDTTEAAYRFDGSAWVAVAGIIDRLKIEGQPVYTSRGGIDQGLRLRDIDDSGRCAVIVSNPKQNAIFAASEHGLEKLPFALPEGTRIVDEHGRDAGLRFVDVDEDGRADVLFSNDDSYGLYLFKSMTDGWSRKVSAGKRVEGDQRQIPAIVRDGRSNGAWFLNRTMWVQNEDTANLPDIVDRRTFGELLGDSDTVARTPEQEMHSLHVRPGFVAELMAAEPLVESPIAIAWGPDGRLWVVEMGDYPLGIDAKGTPGGKVIILESSHGDGHYDKSTVFLDNLPFPTGVMPWGKGVLVTCAPDIFYAEDSHRDGHCDIRKNLFSGFGEGNQQHRLNGLLWGLDNWAHGANGNSNGIITSFNNARKVNISSRDFRIRPDAGLIETETGVTQYGHCMDDWGTWFGCNNSWPMYQFVIEDRYLRRNPFLEAPKLDVNVSDDPGAIAVYPTSRTMMRFNDPWSANHFTSANSAIVYRDDLFGPAFSNSTFVSEPVHDLVHREVLRREGNLYHSRRADDEQTSDFFTSADNWCRPTMLRTGPDGALWIVDMYRQVIEHPEWIPKDWQARLDLRAGHTLGRIFRVYPAGVTPRPIPRLDGLDAAGLVAALDSPSGWQRDMAQQMLVQRKDAAAVPLLEKMVGESKNALARLHALCTLDGLDALGPEIIIEAMRDPEAGVRRQAARLCEGRFDKSPALGETLAGLAGDPDPRVRLQVACTLGEWSGDRAAAALARIALQDGDDPYILTGVISSLTKQNLPSVVRAVLSDGAHHPSEAVLAQLLRLAGAMNDAGATSAVLSRVAEPVEGRYARSQFTALGALLDKLGSSGQSLDKLTSGGGDEPKAARAKLDGLFAAARAIAADDKADEPDRSAAARLLGRQEEDLAELAGLLSPKAPDSAQQAAVDALGHLHGDVVPQTLLKAWKGFGPALRTRALDVLLARPEWSIAVLGAIEKHQVLATDIDAPHRQRLLQSRDKAVRQQADRLFAEVIKPDRQKVVEQFAAALTLPGDAARGAAFFTKTCTPCHILNGLGHSVGPDLASVGDKSPEGLLIAILDPNRAVEPQYVNYVAETNDGQIYSGVVGRETGSNIMLKLPGGAEQSILRGDLRSFRSTGLSLMPEGLEAGVSPQDLADVIAFVRGAGPGPTTRPIEGNHPQIVMPALDGSVQLLPATAEIHGSKIVLEKKYGNLGFWQAEDDHAVWAFESPRAANYTVVIDYACDEAAAGNTLLLQVGSERVEFHVESTGNWDTYRRKTIGKLKLPAGRLHLTARSPGPIHGALLDLRSIELFLPDYREKGQ